MFNTMKTTDYQVYKQVFSVDEFSGLKNIKYHPYVIHRFIQKMYRFFPHIIQNEIAAEIMWISVV